MIRLNIMIIFLIATILCIRKLFYNKISKKLQYALWITLPIYIFLFPFIKIELPLFSSSESTIVYDEKEDYVSRNSNTNIEVKKLNIGEDSIIDSQKNNSSQKFNSSNDIQTKYKLNDLLSAIYYIVVFCFLLFVLIKNIICYCRCLKNRKYYRYDINTKLNIYTLNDISSPFLLGKNIYVDDEMIKEKKYFKYMLIHEYCHWKHGDVFWKIINIGLTIYLWYNPFVWIASYYANRDCELACDEEALDILGA